MSKWLRRGYQQNEAEGATTTLEQRPDDSPSQTHPHESPNMATGTATQHYATPPSPPVAAQMPAYGPSGQHPSSAPLGLVDGGYHERNKGYGSSPMTTSNHYGSSGSGNGTSKSSTYHERPGRSVRSRHSSSPTPTNGEDGEGQRHRSRSNRSNGSARGSSNRRMTSPTNQQGHPQYHHQHHGSGNSQQYHYESSPQQPSGLPPMAGGSGGPPSRSHQYHHAQASSHHHMLPQAPPPPPPPQYPKGSSETAIVSPGPESSFPPQVSSSQSQSSSHRRPAYLLHRDLVIGKGSYGQVCIASRGEAEGHSSSGARGSSSGKRKKFACKCVVLRNDPKYIAKLQEEVNVLRELRGHENVIRLYDVFCVDNELFIITELGRGGDLFHLLTTHPKHGVTESYAAKTVAQMLSAVAFLHSRNICHRDLKLENWVLESGKDVWSPLKLIDFGLSTHFTPGHRLSRVVGSSYYVAPEVLKKSYSEACDLWSLGVIVYMLLSGAPPFYGKNDEAIKASIVQGEYTFPHELFRDVSDEAMAFVSTLLSYNVEYRYTAEQALTHPWLAGNCDLGILQRAKEGARGVGPSCLEMGETGAPEPMQL